VEAAARGGDAELAGAAFGRLKETTQPCGTDFALGIEARCRALLSDGAAADELYRGAGRIASRPSQGQTQPQVTAASPGVGF
jgi:hypothetical protein